MRKLLVVALILVASPLHAQYVYVTNKSSNSISAYKLGLLNELTFVGSYPTGNFDSFGGPSAVAVDPQNRFVFVANPGAGNITSYRINNGGSLTFVGAYGLFGTVPESIAVDPSGVFLYAAGPDLFNHQGSVSAFDISLSGALGQLGEWPVDSQSMNTVAVDPHSKYVYVGGTILNDNGDPVAGSVAMFQEEQGGTLSLVSTDDIRAPFSYVVQFFVTGLAVDPTGQFVYASLADLIPTPLGPVIVDEIRPYRVNSAGLQVIGALCADALPKCVPAGETFGGKETLAVDPSGKYLYVPTVAFDANFHALSQLWTFSIAPDGTPVHSSTASAPEFEGTAAVDPTGQFAFALACSAIGDCSGAPGHIDTFTVGGNGTLALRQMISTGHLPDSISTTSCLAPLPGAQPDGIDLNITNSTLSSPFVTTAQVSSGGTPLVVNFIGTLQAVLQTKQYGPTCPAVTYGAHLNVQANGQAPVTGATFSLIGNSSVEGATLAPGSFAWNTPLRLAGGGGGVVSPNPISVQSFVTVNAQGAVTSLSTPPSNLVSWWQAEGNFADATGTNPGTSGGVVNFVPGRVGQAFNFSFVSDILPVNDVQVASSATLKPRNVTVAAWVKHSGAPGHDQYIVSQGAKSCFAASYALYTGAQNLTFYISDGGNFYEAPDAGPTVWDGNWHFVAGTYDGTAVRLYVDGVQVGNGTPVSTAINYTGMDNDNFYIGAYRGSCNLGFPGAVDEVRVFNRALSAAEIQSIFTSTP